MSLKVKTLKVFPVFEEHCFANQIIAQLKVIRTDGIAPHIVYKKYDSDEKVYNYFTVNDVNGNIHLTLDGVNAINKDYPNPEKELQELKFKIRAEDREEGDHIDVDVIVKIVRIHDEPPKMLEEVIYDLYQDDSKEGKIILDLRTLYPAYFSIADDNLEYFHFVINDFGRLTMTNTGIDYIKKLDPDKTRSINIKIEIRDKQNHKVIYKTYIIPIKKGKALQSVPKKAILEQIAQYLGEDLAYKIEKLNDEVEDLYDKVNFLIEEYIDPNGPIMNSFDGTGVYNFLVGADTNYLSKSQILMTNNEIINLLNKSNSKIFQEVLNQYIGAIKEPINYNQQELLSHTAVISKASNNSGVAQINNFTPDGTFVNYFKALKNQMSSRINQVLKTIILPLIKDMRRESWDEVERLEKDYLQFKIYDSKVIFQKIMKKVFELFHILQDDDWSDIKKYTTKNGNNGVGLIGKVWDNELRIDDLERLLYKHKASSFASNRTYVYNYLPSFNKNRNGVVGLIYDIDFRNLEDWSVNATGANDWKMITNSDGTKSIKVGSNTVFYVNGSNTTVRANSTVFLNAGGTRVSYNGSTLKVGGGVGDNNSKVDANLFTGTATKAKYADLAEYYESDNNYEPGTVLMIGGEKEVTRYQYNSGPYVGVVSENPGFILNSGEKEGIWVIMALRGRVKIKLEKNLKVKKGQALYASEIEPGVAGIKENKFFIGYVLKTNKNKEALVII